MSLERRIEALEYGRAADTCTCSTGLRIVYAESYRHWQDAPEPRGERCAVCGRQRVTLRVEYTQEGRVDAHVTATG